MQRLQTHQASGFSMYQGYHPSCQVVVMLLQSENRMHTVHTCWLEAMVFYGNSDFEVAYASLAYNCLRLAQWNGQNLKETSVIELHRIKGIVLHII